MHDTYLRTKRRHSGRDSVINGQTSRTGEHFLIQDFDYQTQLPFYTLSPRASLTTALTNNSSLSSYYINRHFSARNRCYTLTFPNTVGGD